MKLFTSVEQLIQDYGSMTKKEREQAKKFFGYVIMRDLEKDISLVEVFSLLNPLK